MYLEIITYEERKRLVNELLKAGTNPYALEVLGDDVLTTMARNKGITVNFKGGKQ